MFTVMDELAHRVADRSPPSKLTSTASAFAMFSTLSVSALISSREYIMVGQVYQRAGSHEDIGTDALPPEHAADRRRRPLFRAWDTETLRRAGQPISRARVRDDADVRGRCAG